MTLRSLALCIAFLVALFPAAAHAGADISASATCNSGSVTLSWSYMETSPVGLPDWAGYDVYRRAVEPCGPWVRLNADIIPRDFSGNHSRQFVDGSATTTAAYEYEVWPVDQNHVLVALPQCSECVGTTVASCPSLGAAMAHGTLEDLGWAMLIHACTSSCSPASIIENNLDALRPYAGTGTALALYGTVACGGVEGCTLTLDHFDVADCGPVPILPGTWGSLKARYR